MLFIVAFFCLIPTSSGATFTDSKPAHILITFQIPETTPIDVPQAVEAPTVNVEPTAPTSTEQPPASTIPLPLDPPVVQPVVPEPVQSDPPAPAPPAPEEQPSAVPLPDPVQSSIPTDSEGSPNEEVSP